MSGAPPAQAKTISAYYRDQLGGGPGLVYALDPQFTAVRAYQVRSLGTTVVIDDAGVVRFRDARTTSSDTLRAALQEAGL